MSGIDQLDHHQHHHDHCLALSSTNPPNATYLRRQFTFTDYISLAHITRPSVILTYSSSQIMSNLTEINPVDITCSAYPQYLSGKQKVAGSIPSPLLDVQGVIGSPIPGR